MINNYINTMIVLFLIILFALEVKRSSDTPKFIGGNIMILSAVIPIYTAGVICYAYDATITNYSTITLLYGVSFGTIIVFALSYLSFKWKPIYKRDMFDFLEKQKFSTMLLFLIISMLVDIAILVFYPKFLARAPICKGFICTITDAFVGLTSVRYVLSAEILIIPALLFRNIVFKAS